jgi:hypothetical protein
VPARSVLADAIAASPTRLCVIAGGPGLGKSNVLWRVAEHPAAGLCVAPHDLRLSSDLQQVLLQQVAALLHTIADEENVEQIGRRLLTAAGSLAAGAARELATSVALRLFEVATAGVGPKVAQRLKPLYDEFAAQGTRSKAYEVGELLRPDPLDLLLEFLEVSTELTEGSLTLRVDEAQNVDDRGLRLLADLSRALPDRTRVVVAWRTSTRAERDALVRLVELAPQLELHDLQPLTSSELNEWLQASQAAGLDAEKVRELTAGSPLVIADALRRGLPSTQAGAVRELVARTLETLRPETRAALARFAVLSRRPPNAELLKIAEVDEPDLARIEVDFRDAGLFSGAGEEGPWLHELRREAVIDLLLDEPARAAACRAAADAIAPRAFVNDDWQLELLGLVRGAHSTYHEHAAERVLIDLPWDQVALLAANLELVERSQRMTAIDPLLRYARDVWHATGDLVAALEQLTQAGLLQLRDDGGTPWVGRDPWSPAVAALLCGLCLEHLGRRPIRDLVGSVVTFGLQSLLGGAEGHFARLGDAGQHDLVCLAHAVLPGDSRAEPRPTLVARLSFRDVPMPLVAWYADAVSRDEAIAELRGFAQPLFGNQLRVQRVAPLPTGPEPCTRFLYALGRAMGVGREELDEAREASPPLSIDESLLRRLRTFDLLWELATPGERAAMELDERTAFAWTIQDDWFWEAEVHGGRRGVEEMRLAHAVRFGPLTRFRLVEALALTPDEDVLGPRGQAPPPGRDLPEVEAVEMALERADGYNGTLPPLVLPVEPSRLAELCREALERELVTAEHLRDRLPLPRSDRAPGALEPWSLMLLVPATTSADEMWMRGEPWCVYAWESACRVDVQVAAIDGLSPGDTMMQAARALEDHGYEPRGRVESFGIALATDFLASVLGYRPQDLRLHWPLG